jgi:hypothetical protein
MAQGSGRFDTSVVGLVSLAMEDGFFTALAELAKHHDNQVGPWLDQIEADVMSGLKGSVVEGVGMKVEADAMVKAVRELEAFFKDFRESLEKQ